MQMPRLRRRRIDRGRVEESCARLGLEVVAIVQNVDGPPHALARDRVVAADDVGPALAAHPYLVPIFTPGHRLAAHHDALRRGFARAATVIDPTAVMARSAAVGAGSYVNALAAAPRRGSANSSSSIVPPASAPPTLRTC